MRVTSHRCKIPRVFSDMLQLFLVQVSRSLIIICSMFFCWYFMMSAKPILINFIELKLAYYYLHALQGRVVHLARLALKSRFKCHDNVHVCSFFKNLTGPRDRVIMFSIKLLMCHLLLYWLHFYLVYFYFIFNNGCWSNRIEM